MHARIAPRTDVENVTGAHLDMAVMRSLMTIHTLNRCTFPLHEMNPEERFESHGIINMRVMRWQIHPSDDEQTIYLQRDGRQSIQDQPCTSSVEFAANNAGAYSATGQEL